MYLHLIGASIMVTLLLNGSAVVLAQSVSQFEPFTSSNQLSPSTLRIIDSTGRGSTFASDVSAPSFASLGRSLSGISSSEVAATGTADTSTAFVLAEEPNPDTNSAVILADIQPVNPNLPASSNTRTVNPLLQAQLAEVPETLNTLNPPFRLCLSGAGTAAQAQAAVASPAYSNFATYTIVGKADFSDLVKALDKKGEEIMLQLYVDYETATVTGFMTVAEDKMKTLHNPLQSPEGDTARQTLDEAGTVRLEISQFKPIFNTECERTVTGIGGGSFVPGDPTRLSDSQRAHTYLPFKTCETFATAVGGPIPTNIGAELKSAIWTIQGDDLTRNIQRLGDKVGGGDTPFNMQIYNDLLTGVIKGTLFIDPPNNGIVDIADTNDDVGDRVEFSPKITGECYRQPNYNL